jgi:hypothetical protein
MTVAIDDRRIEHSATLAQTLFTYNFPPEETTAVDVWHRPIATGIPVALAQEFTGAPAVGKFFVNLSIPGTKEVTLHASQCLAGDGVIIEANTDIDRLTDYIADGDITAASLNTDLNKTFELLQEHRRDLNRMVQLHDGETDTIDLTLPTPLVAGAAIGLNSDKTALAFYATSEVFDIDVAGLSLYDHLEFNGSEWAAISGATYAGNVQINAELDITGDVEIGSGTIILRAIGSIEIEGAAEIGGNLDVIGALDVSGAVDFAGALDVAGTTTIHDDVEISGGNFEVSGNAVVGDDLDVTGGTTTLSGSADASSPALHIDANTSDGILVDAYGSWVTAGGATAHSDADNLVLQHDASQAGLSILSTSTGSIYFGDIGSATRGRIRYVHGDDSMDFYTAGSLILTLDNTTSTFTSGVTVDGSVGVGTTDPKEPLGVVGDITLQAKNKVVMFNVYYESGWKHADANGSTGYGGIIQAKQDGGLDFRAASSVGAADDAAASFSAITHLSSAGNWTFGGDVLLGANNLWFDDTHDMHKIRLWTSNDQYSIGMDNGSSGLTYGGLTGYAMTFTMSASGGFGWLWRLYNSLDHQGVMSLNTAGELTVLGDSQFESNLVVGTDAIFNSVWTDYDNHVFVSGANARLTAQGSLDAGLVLIDSGAGTNLKVFGVKTLSGVTTMNYDNDDGSIGGTFFSFNHSNGEITPSLSNSGTSGCLIVVGGFVKIAES